MLVLSKCDKKDVAQFARQLFNKNRNQRFSFEKAAQIAVEAIYSEFRQNDGEPLFALVRIFRFSKRTELHPEQVAIASTDTEYWLTLMASIGSEPAWCDRRSSKDHQVIPADNPMTPMLKGAFQQIGLRFGAEIQSTLEIHKQERSSQARYFHVPVATGSPLVPVQEGFVTTYNIQSVIGIGSNLAEGTSYFCIGFSQEPIDEKDAATFAEMNPFIGTLLAFHSSQAIWE